MKDVMVIHMPRPSIPLTKSVEPRGLRVSNYGLQPVSLVLFIPPNQPEVVSLISECDALQDVQMLLIFSDFIMVESGRANQMKL
jgi:hypothetical protein